MSAAALVLLAGRPGTGKSTVADLLRAATDVRIVSSDEIRKELYPSPTYAASESDTVYRELVKRVGETLAEASSVVIDATHYRSPSRTDRSISSLKAMADDEGCAFVAVELVADTDTLKGRLTHRSMNPRPAWDQSDADASTLDDFAGRVGPYEALEISTVDFDAEQVASILLPLLDGRRDPLLADQHVGRHQRLDRLARNTETQGLGDQRLMSLIDDHARDDAANADLMSRWWLSSLIDENTRKPIVSTGVARWLTTVSTMSLPENVAHAGLAHTYGYLLSHSWTRYGWKRDRYLNGDLAALIDVEPDMLTPWAPEGTMLGNLTASLDAFTSGSSGTVVVISERGDARSPDPELVDVTFLTRIYRTSVAVPEKNLLVYSVRFHGKDEQLITAFTIDDDFATSLEGQPQGEVEINPKFNVALTGPARGIRSIA